MAAMLALEALRDAGAPDAADEGLEQLLRLLEADGWLGASGAGRGAATASSWEDFFEGGGSDVLLKNALLALAEQEEAWRKLLLARNDRAIAAAQQEEFDIERQIEILRDALAARAAAARRKTDVPAARSAAVPHKKAKADEWRRDHLEGQSPLSCGALNYGAPLSPIEVVPARTRRDGIKWPQWVETPGKRAAERARKQKARREAQKRQKEKDPKFGTSQRKRSGKGRGSADRKQRKRRHGPSTQPIIIYYNYY